MIREINLEEYLPSYLLEYKELNAILKIESERLQNIEIEHWQMVDNRFIKSCNEVGIARFENMLGIKPLDNDSLDDRIFRVLTVWNKSIPYNYKYLYNQMVTLCGADGFEIELNGLYLKIKVALTRQNMIDIAKEILDEIIPCNVIAELILLYNSYEVLHDYQNFVLEQFTNFELRNISIDKELDDTFETVCDYTCNELENSKYHLEDIETYGLRKKV